jgi:hypothetical protein
MTKNALSPLHNTRLISYRATARRLMQPTYPLGWDDVIQECGMIGYDVWSKRIRLINFVRMIQCPRSQRLSLPSIRSKNSH